MAADEPGLRRRCRSSRPSGTGAGRGGGVGPVRVQPTRRTAIIGNLGSKMSFVGLFMLGIGLFFFVSGIVRWFRGQRLPGREHALLDLLFIVVGIWTHRAGREFRSVAETQGKDISHLMGALANLLKLYTLLYLLFFIALVFAIIQLGAYSLYGTRAATDAGRQAGRVQSQGSSASGLAGLHVVKGHLERRPCRPRRRSATYRPPASTRASRD